MSRIGSALGKPLFADECTTSQSRISFARLLVEIDVTQPIQYKVLIEGTDGVQFEQKVVYDWIPPYCGKCKMAGHDCNKVKPKSYQEAL